MRHLISVLIENEAGALSRVVGLFSARGYNIETLTVAPTEDHSLSRMTIVTAGSDDVLEQINCVCWQGVCVLTLHQVNGACLDSPHVDATIGPVSKHDV